jgi:hypothetical protein
MSQWEKASLHFEHLSSLMQEYEKWSAANEVQYVLIFMDDDAYKIARRATIDWELMIEHTSKYISVRSIVPCMYSNYQKQEGKFFQLWWEHDRHHNSEGYGLMAKCIFPNLRKYFPAKVYGLQNPQEIPIASPTGQNK